jgi:hypothetical protein
MSTIVTRSGKGSPLTNTEVDANFTNLNTGKAELSGAVFTGAITTNSTIDGRDVATDGTKLDGVEASADVTDATNVTAAGALMDSELTSIASVKALNQGVATGDSPTFAAVTANGGVVVDNFTLDGTTLALSSGDMTLDAAGRIDLSADDNGEIRFFDGSSMYGQIKDDDDRLKIQGLISNKAMLLVGNDGGSEVTMLSLDAENAGNATFSGSVTANAGVVVDNITIDGSEIDCSSGNLVLDGASNITFDADGGQVEFKDAGALKAMIDFTGNNVEIQSRVTDGDLLFRGLDGSSFITALQLDISLAGFATFNNGIRANRDIASFGANTGSSANRMALSMEGSGVSRLICNGPDGSTNGTFEVFTAYSGGTGSVKLGVAANGKVKIASATTATPQLTIGGTTGGGSRGIELLDDNAGKYNFLIAAQEHINNGFEITPSTAVGGTTYTNPALVIEGATGNVIFNENGIDADFRIESSGNTHMLFVDGGENRVGIGIATPAAPLHVDGTNAGIRFTDAGQDIANYYGDIYKDYNGNAHFIIESVSNGVGTTSINPAGGPVLVGGAATFASTIGVAAGTVSLPSLSFSSDTNTGIYSPSADNLGFAIGAQARAFMSATQFNMSGNVVSTGLDCNGNADVSGTLGVTGTSTFTNILTRQGVASTSSVYANGTVMPHMISLFNQVTGATNSPCGISFVTRSGDNSGANWQTGIVAHSGGNYANYIFQANTSEKIRIDTSGVLVVGNQSFQSGSCTAQLRGASAGATDEPISSSVSTTGGAYQYAVYNSNGRVGSITTSGSATAFNTSSDERLKENIANAADAGALIDAIKVRQFDWKVDALHQDYGMIAQELKTVVPAAVHAPADETEMMSVDYSKLVPLLVKEIQSLRDRLAVLEGE